MARNRPNQFRVPKLAQLSLWLVVLWWVFSPVIISADALFTQAFQTSKPEVAGTIVSLTDSTNNVIQAANTSNVDTVFGVVVGSDNAPLTLTFGTKNQVEVATSGVVDTLVSDYNGPVTIGDQITASPIDGVGMVASTNVKVVGVAEASLANSVGKTTQTFTDKKGQKQTAQLGVVPVEVNVAYYFKQPEKTIIPSVIQNIANTVANKKVSPLPILVSLLIFFITTVSIIILIYAAIRSSIISVGRNPLSQAAVYRSLMQVSALVLSIVGVAVAAIYLILTRL